MIRKLSLLIFMSFACHDPSLPTFNFQKKSPSRLETSSPIKAMNSNNEHSEIARGIHRMKSGDFIGNGGNVVQCDGENWLLLDLYEGKEIYGLQYDHHDNLESHIVQYTIEQLNRLDPRRSVYLKNAVENFRNRVRYVSIDLAEIHDHGPLVFRNCRVKQAAIFKENPSAIQPQFLVSRELWQSLEPLHRAALVLHEVLYLEAVRTGHEDSRYVRQYVAWLLSTRLSRATIEEYQQFVMDIYMASASFLKRDSRTSGSDVFIYQVLGLPQVDVKTANHHCQSLGDGNFFLQDLLYGVGSDMGLRSEFGKYLNENRTWGRLGDDQNPSEANTSMQERLADPQHRLSVPVASQTKLAFVCAKWGSRW